MYAIVRTGGKQYTAREGETLVLERIHDKKPGDSVEFTDVLLLAKDDGDVRVGAPLVAGASVRGTVVREYRGPKIDVVKFRRREDSMTKKGHRQTLMRVKIDKIQSA
jgi:large subunit ribosomal protein L21